MRGGVEAWRRGGVEAWRRGGVEAWRRGGADNKQTLFSKQNKPTVNGNKIINIKPRHLKCDWLTDYGKI